MISFRVLLSLEETRFVRCTEEIAERKILIETVYQGWLRKQKQKFLKLLLFNTHTTYSSLSTLKLILHYTK